MREITSGLTFPEGPVALADGSVALVEIQRRTITRVAPDGAKFIVAETGGGPNGLALGPNGAFYVTNNGGFEFHEDEFGLRPTVQALDYSGGRLERVDASSGSVTVLHRDGGTGHPLRGPNDLVFDREGGCWFTDLGKRRARDLDYGGVYYAAPDGSIREIAHPVMTPNGIGLSPDEKTLYVAETEGGRLWAFDIEEPGRIRRQPWPSPHGGRMLYTAGAAYERFDSLAVEESGNICVATLMNGGISVVSPSGDLVEFVRMPDPYTTNICFGGKDRKTAFVTLSSSGRLVAMDWPRAGLKLNFATP
ncbi:MAG: SMP-30/gluconolactonase/LRE family protein [Geminicoccaceae bacterium]|nr:SMP-30/gluconolactonase/LRE family protein [Geminicoccaceae bacterium]